MTDFIVQDGLEELKLEMPKIIEIIVRTARWVHPETFKALPVWYPERARGLPNYNAAWNKILQNKRRTTGEVTDKREANIFAKRALMSALGISGSTNWTVCHIWGFDDPGFTRHSEIVSDRRYYSCIGNMVLLPTPLKGFTDSVPEIKLMLRTCAYHLYDWTYDQGTTEIAELAKQIKNEPIPREYPKLWPSPGRRILPPGISSFSSAIQSKIKKRKSDLKQMIHDPNLIHFPRSEVLDVLKFWKIEL
jgi:hypothetical protein